MKSKFPYIFLVVLTFHLSACLMMRRAKMKTYYEEKIILKQDLINLDCSFEAMDKNIYYFRKEDILENCYDEKGNAWGRDDEIKALYSFIESTKNLNFKFLSDSKIDTVKTISGKDSIITKPGGITKVSRGMQSLLFRLLELRKGKVFVKNGEYYPEYLTLKKKKNRLRSVVFEMELPNKENLISVRVRG